MAINSEAEKEQFAQQEQEQPPTESEDQIKKFLAENFKEGLDNSNSISRQHGYKLRKSTENLIESLGMKNE